MNKALTALTHRASLTLIMLCGLRIKVLATNYNPLPPAEGAKKSCLNCRFHNSPYLSRQRCGVGIVSSLIIMSPKQPTAEGAGEILEPLIIPDEMIGEILGCGTKFIGYQLQYGR